MYYQQKDKHAFQVFPIYCLSFGSKKKTGFLLRNVQWMHMQQSQWKKLDLFSNHAHIIFWGRQWMEIKQRQIKLKLCKL